VAIWSVKISAQGVIVVEIHVLKLRTGIEGREMIGVA